MSEGIKYDSGKVPLNLISNYAMRELARVLQFGAEKYEPWNWSKGIAFSRVISAAKRHIAEWEDRNDIDDESKTNHLANAMCNLMFLLDYQARDLKEFDDRRPAETLKDKTVVYNPPESSPYNPELGTYIIPGGKAIIKWDQGKLNDF